MSRFGLLASMALLVSCQDTAGLFQSSQGAGGASSTVTSGHGTTSAQSSTASSSTGTKASSATTGTSTVATTTSTTVATTSTTTGGQDSTWCNGAPCNPGEVCCYSNTLSGLDKCAAAGTCMVGFVQLKCNGPEGCPNGLQCCAKWSNSAGWQGSECYSSCLSSERTMCYGDPSVCTNGEVCVSSQSLGNGYAYCANGGG
jgi:hypothetical protein